jgi:hypothetical protein
LTKRTNKKKKFRFCCENKSSRFASRLRENATTKLSIAAPRSVVETTLIVLDPRVLEQDPTTISKGSEPRVPEKDPTKFESCVSGGGIQSGF